MAPSVYITASCKPNCTRAHDRYNDVINCRPAASLSSLSRQMPLHMLNCPSMQLAWAEEQLSKFQWLRLPSEQLRGQSDSAHGIQHAHGDWQLIAGANERSYTCQAADVGCQLRVDCTPAAARRVTSTPPMRFLPWSTILQASQSVCVCTCRPPSCRRGC